MGLSASFVTPGVAFLLTLAFGVWLSRAGKPLNTAIFIVHKLIALGAVVAMAMRTYDVLKGEEIPTILLVLIILIGVCVVALFATGALMSANKPAYPTLLAIHKVAPLLSLIAGAAAIYLLRSTG
jgi:hypothetical protein